MRRARELRRRVLRSATLCSAATLFGLAGCGTSDGTPAISTHPVEGKVLLANGQPLTTGRVYFVPKDEKALQAIGDIGPDGHFALATYKSGDGAVEGQYRVKVDPTPVDPQAKPVKRTVKVPPRYTDEDTSGLVVTIDSGTQQLEPIRLR